MAKFLFVTDLDYTLVGDNLALENLNEWLDKQRRIHGTVICYTTGRSFPLYQQLLAQQKLLEPDILMLAVGTEIYYPDRNIPNQNWANKISQSWERQEVVKIANRVAKEFPALTMLPSIEQTPFKASYYINSPEPYQILSYLKTAFESQDLAVNMVDWAGGKYLDILPQDANKGSAVAFIQESLDFTDERTIICGDSGNDLSMFQDVPSYDIIVGNAQPEVLDWQEKYPSKRRYLAKNHFAAGILEGLEYYGFLNIHEKNTRLA